AVNAALGSSFDAAEKLLLERFASVTLADLAADVDQRWPTEPDGKWTGPGSIFEHLPQSGDPE
ncbi:MAG TPA: transcriptional regulator, partial [Thalassospira sp.]|nr:transcriptional regulator [Thalassospira sp.]